MSPLVVRCARARERRPRRHDAHSAAISRRARIVASRRSRCISTWCSIRCPCSAELSVQTSRRRGPARDSRVH
eukprot:4069576-Pleurochrysis_carterae.AAC.1